MSAITGHGAPEGFDATKIVTHAASRYGMAPQQFLALGLDAFDLAPLGLDLRLLAAITLPRQVEAELAGVEPLPGDLLEHRQLSVIMGRANVLDAARPLPGGVHDLHRTGPRRRPDRAPDDRGPCTVEHRSR